MNTYLIKFRWKNHEYEEVIHSHYDSAARALIRNKYPSATIKVVKRVNS